MRYGPRVMQNPGTKAPREQAIAIIVSALASAFPSADPSTLPAIAEAIIETLAVKGWSLLPPTS
jgi:hypothetical protein